MDATKTSDISIRQIETFAELRAVEELEQEVWGIPDLDVVPITHLVATRAAGGVLLGAFDRNALVGFVYGFVALEEGELAHHSHMLAVKPAYRNFNLGYKLKLAQRDTVLAQGIKLITWTFDPLQSLNAHFNFTKLGVISNRYLIDFYGEEASSFLHQSGTDRLWVKWLLTSDRVIERLEADMPALAEPAEKLLIEIPGNRIAIMYLGRIVEIGPADKLLIEIPGNINAVQQHTPNTAREWRKRTRAAFTAAIDKGYTVLDFYREMRGDEKVGIYILGLPVEHATR